MTKIDLQSSLLRVILVDDDCNRADAVESKLQQVGYDVLSVIPTGSGLLYQMAQQNPDVVIIALDSPDRDVLESLSIASSHNPRPVVMFSESGDHGFITDAIRAGVTAYQAEDISPNRVRAAINVAVAQFSAFNDIKRELQTTRQQLSERKQVEKAKGLLMSVHKVAEEEAFGTLRKLAMDNNKTLGETAGDVIAILGKATQGELAMIDTRRLPACEKSELSVGYLRLTDSAPVIMARELGLYTKYDLDVTLQREVSWANLRDKLVTGDLDATQMLAPLPLATSLGVGGMRADVITGLALSLNGNAITLSPGLSAIIDEHGGRAVASARSTAVALGQWLRGHGGAEQLTFASAHTFSCHTFLLRLWLQAGGIDPERDVRIIVLPPEQMVDSLTRGIIDGFCVGEPWNSMAVQRGVGAVQASGYQIWNNGLEKVLAVLEGWHQKFPATHLRLRIALMEACSWLAHPANREEAAAVLALPEYLNTPVDYLLPSLTGEFVYAKGQEPAVMPHFHVFGRFQAGFPWRSHGEWLLQQTGALLGKTLPQESVKALVQRTFRTDLYREAARYLELPSPSGDYKPINQHDQVWEFEPGIELGPDMSLS